MAREKVHPPLLDTPRCEKCGCGVVRQTYDKYIPGEVPVRITVHRCIGYKKCPLKVVEQETLSDEPFVFHKEKYP